MGKQRCWLGLLKKILVSDAKPKPEKKSRKWKWIIRRLKLEHHHHALPAPDKSLRQATEDQRKHVLNVAIATAAAAEAAIAAAQAAAEVVRITAVSKPFHHLTTLDRNQAAVIIQTAFRAHLARKALRALKGLVKLQAIVRGRAVRRRAMINRKCSQSVKEKRSSATQVTLMHKDHCQYECNSRRTWNDSVLSKEDIEAKLLRSKEAMAKRERMKKYSYSNRVISAYIERANTRVLDELVHAEANERERPSMSSNFSTFEVLDGPPRVRFRNVQKEDTMNGTNSSVSFPRT